MGLKTKKINGEDITIFAKDRDTSKKAIFMQSLTETAIEVGGQLLTSFLKRKK